MKKTLALMLTFLLVFSLSACGGDKKTNSEASKKEEVKDSKEESSEKKQEDKKPEEKKPEEKKPEEKKVEVKKEEKKETKKEEIKTQDGDFDKLDGSFMIRGAKYTLPSTLGEISAIDNMKVDVDVKELSGNVRGLVDGVLEKEDSSNSSGLVRLNLSVVNYSKDTIDINDGKIFRIRFNSGYSKQTSEVNKDEVTFPCNVKFAMSEEEVIDAYGQADKVEDGKGYKVLIYQKDHGDKVVDEFKFVFNDDLDSGEYYLNDVEINMSDLAEMRANR